MYARVFAWVVRAIRRYVPYDSRLFNSLYFIYIRMTSRKRLKRKTAADMNIQIHMAEHCNLNCKGCNAFAPLIEECFVDIDEIKRDITRFSELSGGVVGSLTISGGEPLLNPNLTEILSYARRCFPKQSILIITNGLLLGNVGEDFWEACKTNDVSISFTCYPTNQNEKNITKLASAHSVRFTYQDDTDIREKTMSFTPLDPNGGQNVADSYRFCFMSNYNFIIENGNIYTCPVIAHIEHFNKYFNQNFRTTEKDYLNLYKVNDIDEILDFFCKPMPFCRYCNQRSRVSGVRWEQSKKDISEWM